MGSDNVGRLLAVVACVLAAAALVLAISRGGDSQAKKARAETDKKIDDLRRDYRELALKTGELEAKAKAAEGRLKQPAGEPAIPARPVDDLSPASGDAEIRKSLNAKLAARGDAAKRFECTKADSDGVSLTASLAVTVEHLDGLPGAERLELLKGYLRTCEEVLKDWGRDHPSVEKKVNGKPLTLTILCQGVGRSIVSYGAFLNGEWTAAK
jgi:hypothetical protein